MKAITCERYGPPEVLQLKDVERPDPKPDEIRIKVHATTVTRTDCGFRSAQPYFFARLFTGLLAPRRQTPGMEVAGEVDAIGANVTDFHVADRVFGISLFGAYAEFVCVRGTDPITQMPAGLAFNHAAAVCDGGCTALSCLRQAGVRDGTHILIYGASGSIGTASVQIARHLGAVVTAVCGTKNVDLVRSLGATEVIDYQRDDFTTNGKTYDVIFDAVGKHSYRRCGRSLKPGGTFMTTDLGFMWHLPVLMLWTKVVGDKRATIGLAQYKKDDVVFLKELVERGQYRPVIDRSYPLDRVVEATRYVESGQKTGNVVLIVEDG